jgi:hypothetical protein
MASSVWKRCVLGPGLLFHAAELFLADILVQGRPRQDFFTAMLRCNNVLAFAGALNAYTKAKQSTILCDQDC